MAKAPVLGNDPFQRGAAERMKPLTPPSPAQPAAAPSAPRAAPAGARPTTDRKAPQSTPKRDSKRSAPSPRARGPAAVGDATPAAEPAQKPRTKPTRSTSAKRRRAQTHAEPNEAAAKPALVTPAPAPAAAAFAPPPPATARAPEQPEAKPPADEFSSDRVLEGELIDAEAPASRPLLLPGGRHLGETSAAPPLEQSGASDEPTWFARTRQSVVHILAGTLKASLESALARRVSETVGQMPLVQRALGTAAGAAAATAPACALAARYLPPAVGVARTAVNALVSGQAARTLVATAAEAGEAARRIARRVEPPTYEVDPFGEDERLASRLEPLFDFLHDRYFRVEPLGAERVPHGPCLLVCNHSGALPLDGPMIRTVLRRDCNRVDARWLIEDALFHAPFMGLALNRLGAVRACPENAQRLLDLGVALAVFPEGLLGISKPLGMRYKLQRFGRGGFVKVALRAAVPIVPVAIVGAEESSPLLARLPIRSLGLPYLPITTLPLPARWTVSFLPPVDLSAHGREAVEDPAVVSRRTAEVRDAIQQEIDRLIERRRSLLTG